MIYGNYLRNKYNNAAVKLADAEGVPCIMEYSKGKNMRNYEIYGNSVQGGTPSPDTPIEVQSVGDLTTKNLFDLSSSGGFVSDYAGVSCDINGDVATVNYTGSSGRTFYMNLGTFETGTYYFGADVKDIESVTNGKFHIRKVDDNSILNSINNVVTLTEPTEIKFYGTFNTGGTVEISNIQITKSDVPTEYEPYHKYKIPVTVSGANIMNESDLARFDNWKTKEYGETAGGMSRFRIYCKPNTSYTIQIENANSSILFLGTASSTTIQASKMWQIISADTGYFYIRANVYNQTKLDALVQAIGKIMIHEGAYTATTIPKYEPYHEPITTHIYLDEPLRKVGDYADYIDFKNQKVVRNIFKQSLLANSIYKKLADVIRIDGYMAGSIKAKSDTHMLSPMFKYKYAWFENIECVFHHHNTGFNYYWSVFWNRLGLTYDGTDVYRTEDSSRTALTNTEILHIARDWLSTLSEEDKEVYMILDTPTEESVSLPTLKTFKGTSIVSVDTFVLPSNIKTKYVKS